MKKFPRFCNPFFNHPVPTAFANPVYYLCLQAQPPTGFLGEPRTQPCFPPRHDPSVAASYHMTVETFTRGSVARGRNHVILLSSRSRPLCALWPVGGGIVHMINASFGELGLTQEPPGDTGRASELHTETPYRRPRPRYEHR